MVLIDQPSAELVERVGPAVCRAPVKPLGLALVPATLRLGDLLLELATPGAGLEPLAVTGGR